VLVVAGCGSSSSGEAGGDFSTPAINVPEHDAGRAAAQVEAQRHWQEFVDSFRSKPTGLDHNVIVRFQTRDGGFEADWVTVTAIGEDDVTGTIASDPENIGYAYGDKVTVNRARVEDWVISRGKKVVKGYFSHDAVMGVYGG
jgi:uncharacterized protein YegJ (DUF2314 family)